MNTPLPMRAVVYLTLAQFSAAALVVGMILYAVAGVCYALGQLTILAMGMIP